jgi:hypothetical protein
MPPNNAPPDWYPGELSLHQFFDPDGNLRLQPCQNNGPLGKGSDAHPSRIEFIFDYRRHLTIVRQEGGGVLSEIPMIEVKAATSAKETA